MAAFGAILRISRWKKMVPCQICYHYFSYWDTHAQIITQINPPSKSRRKWREAAKYVRFSFEPMNMRFTHARRWTRMYMPKYHRRRCVLAKMWIRLMCLQKRACACCYWRVCASFLLGFSTCKFTVFIDTIQSICCHKVGSFMFAVITTCLWRKHMPWPQLHQITTGIIMRGGDSIYRC